MYVVANTNTFYTHCDLGSVGPVEFQILDMIIEAVRIIRLYKTLHDCTSIYNDY